MGYIYDAILESNEDERDSVKERIKNPPTLKAREKHKQDKLKECSTKNMKKKNSKPTTDLEESKLNEEKLVDIEQYLEPENYVESLQESVEDKKPLKTELPDRPRKGRPGSPEYDANHNRRNRVARYRKYANIPDDFEITPENIDERALIKTCTYENCPKDKLKAELLKQPYTGLENYEED